VRRFADEIERSGPPEWPGLETERTEREIASERSSILAAQVALSRLEEGSAVRMQRITIGMMDREDEGDARLSDVVKGFTYHPDTEMNDGAGIL
jgi:hypothetical protein